MTSQFKHLSLGARFSFIGRPEKTFVKLTNNQVVEWNLNEVVKCFETPIIFEIAHPEFVVEIRERFPDKNQHIFPKTCYEEGYDHYIVHSRWSDNPYPKDSYEYEEFQKGFSEALWEDCM